ncbi:MAG: protein kinase [Anaerolineae bacterium]|nr:protein kinase [Anaerolineae bacterium]
MAVQINLFGSPQCLQDGQLITLHRRKAMALLAYLAVTARPHGRDALATLFWPDYDQSGARANLRRDLSYLKGALGDVVDVSRAEVSLTPTETWRLDTADFAARLIQAQSHNHPADPLCPACQLALTEAVDLYVGDFMVGFTLPDCPEFDEWQFFQREGFRQSLATALQQLIEYHLAQAAFGVGAEYGRRWLSLDPLHEPAHRQLMQLYAWDGQHAAALRQYEECQRLLAEELGVAPDAETATLYENIKMRQLAPPATPTPTAPATAVTTPQTRYRQGEFLAVGGHGELYHGVDLVTGAPVVIKRLRPELSQQAPEYVARFQREGQLLSELNHPNIVNMLALFEFDGQHHIVMEYVSGGSLRQLLEQQPQLPFAQALTIALELADALSRAHHLGIIHRDLKPENVLLAAGHSPRLTDFGLARLHHDDSRITQQGLFIGSPAYMSPEALQGEDLDARGDIWSFGVLLFEMLAGQRPFAGEQVTAVITRILNDPVPDIERFRPDTPPALADLLRHMLVKNRQDRLSSMRQVAAALEAIREGQSGHFGPLMASSSASDRLQFTITPPARRASSTSEEHIFTAHTVRTPTPLPGKPVFHNLPPQPTTFVGRERELQDIHQWLLEIPTRRLITIAGPGGIGKTRLALAAAQSVLDAFADGVFFVPLAPLTTADHIFTTLIENLHLQPINTKEPKDQLLAYLRQKQMLLVLDNFEHLLEGADLVADILQTAPEVKILVTSRERLRLTAESVYALSGLAYPKWQTVPAGWRDEQLAAYDALKLLQQRARAMQVPFPLSPAEREAMVRICHLVEGMPLALMMATSWLPLLSFAEIAAEIAECLDFLEVEMRDLPERQRSMRATIDSSWKRLTAEEQQVFMKLSVFRGGFTRQAAQAVAGASLRSLRALADKSLVSLSRSGRHGRSERCEIHELLRQYGAELLEKAGLAETTHQLHSQYYLERLREYEPAIKGHEQLAALREIEADTDNIRLAWQWAVDHQNLAALDQAMQAFHFFFDLRVRQAEGSQLFLKTYQQLLLSGMEKTAPIMVRLVVRAHFLGIFAAAYAQPDIEAALLKSLAAARHQANQAETAYCLGALGCYYLLVSFEPSRGLPLLQEALTLFRALGDNFFTSRALLWVSLCCVQMGLLTEFYDYAQESVAASLAIGNKVDATYSLVNLVEVAIVRGEYETARRNLQEALTSASEMEMYVPLAYLEMLLGFLHLLAGEMEIAQPLIEKAYRLARDYDYAIAVAFTAGMRALLCSIQGENRQARQLAMESLSITGNHGLGVILANWALAVMACHECVYPDARGFLWGALDMAQQGQYEAAKVWLLPVTAVILAANNENEKALELLSLAYHHPLNQIGWWDHWPPLAELTSRLQAEAGETAWQRGHSLSLEAVTEQLLAAWGIDA